MKTEKMKWLRLELQNPESVSSLYLIFHTHYSIYSYLRDKGYTINIFQPLPFNRFAENPVIYIQTDHQEFFDSCLRNYSRDFSISRMEADFKPAKSFSPMFCAGEMTRQPLSIS